MNTQKIKVEMLKHEYTQVTLAKELNMCTNTLNRKIGGKREFTVSEALRLCEVLSIKNPMEIFLA